MRQYEIVYILHPSLGREAVDDKIDAFHAVLGGEITAVDHWGVRPLAYPIAKLKTACYVVVQVNADPAGLPEFERLVKLDEEALRYLVVLNEGLPTTGDSILAHRPSDAPLETADDEAGDSAADAGPDGDSAPDAAPEADAGEGADGARGEGDADGPEAEQGDGDGPADSDDGAADSGAADDAAGDGGDAAAAEGEADPQATLRMSPSAPPVFSGARGRRRRHDGPPIVLLNYKDVTTLSRFLTEQGKILPKRTTKVTARFQRQLGTAVKRARHLALLPYVRDHEA